MTASGSSTEAVSALLRLIRFVGKFHPSIVHFPIALISIAAVLEILSWFKAMEYFSPGLRTASVINLGIGAIVAVFAAAFGWALAMGMGIRTRP